MLKKLFKKDKPLKSAIPEFKGTARIERITKKDMELQIKKVNPEAKMPEFAHNHDAGMDLYNGSDNGLILEKGARAVIGTGVAVAIPEGHVGLVKDKSGLASKSGITILGGVIDAGYRGEINVIILNAGNDRVTIGGFQKLAQLLIMPVVQPTIIEVDELMESSDARGESGFGSTGLEHSSKS